MQIPGLLFEAVADVGLGGGGDPAPEAAAPVAPEPVAPVEPTPAPAAPTPDPYEDPRFLDLVDTRAAQIAQQQLQELVARSQQQQQTQQAFDPASLTDEYGNLDPAKFAAWAQTRDQHLVQQMQEMFTPLAQQMQAQQEAEVIASGEARLEDILADDIARNGDFVKAAGNSPEQVAAAQQADALARQMVRTKADALFPEIAQRYGQTPRAAEIAMSRAADEVRSLLRAVGQSAQAVQANQLATLAGQQGEVGGAGTGAGALSRPVVKFGERVTDRYAAAGAPVQ